MNIFEIYCAGEGRINETNMSSVLGYLLSPDASHGFGKESLNLFLEPLADDIKALCDNQKLKLAGKIFHPQKLADQLGNVEIKFEEDVYGLSVNSSETTKKREIDLVIRFEGTADKQKLIIAIENKISDGSSTDVHQLEEEYKFLREEIDEIADRLRKGGMDKVATFDGRTSNGKRFDVLNDKNEALILQIQTGCEGLNLQENYSEIYFISPHWNPAVEDQAIARCHRIGQTKPVYVQRFEMCPFVAEQEEDMSDISTQTIDKYVSNVQDEKRFIAEEMLA
jgi:hypothetical protein